MLLTTLVVVLKASASTHAQEGAVGNAADAVVVEGVPQQATPLQAAEDELEVRGDPTNWLEKVVDARHQDVASSLGWRTATGVPCMVHVLAALCMGSR